MKMIGTLRATKIKAYLAAMACQADQDGLAILADRAEDSINRAVDMDIDDYRDALAGIVTLAPPAFAIAFGASRRIVDMGIVGHALMSCATLTQALKIWLSFSGLTGEPFRFQSVIAHDLWSLEFQPLDILAPGVARFCSEELAAAFGSFATEIAGVSFSGVTIEFRHQAHPDIDYSAYIGAKLRFGCRRNAIVMPETVLGRPILSRNDEVFDLLVGHVLLSRSEVARTKIGNQLCRLFMLSPRAIPTLVEAAKELGMSPRSLNRHLRADGQSYTALLAAFRCDYAEALKCDGMLTTKQIAHAVGFRSSQSLGRAFRQRSKTRN